MSLRKKIILILVLSVFVGASVFLSFNAISRKTYEYEEQTNVGGGTVSGCVLVGFNGSTATKDVRIYHPMIEDKSRINGDTARYIEDISRSVVGIDKFTFVSDENMELCHIGPEVAYIDEQAFFGCFALKAVLVDDANPYYTDIDGVLYKKDLSEIILYPTNHITYLRELGKVPEDFYESNPETYDIPEGVRRVATGCFYKTWGIKTITLPSTLEEIGDMSFFKCESLELVSLPEGIRSIGDDSFSFCKSMRWAMFIPDSMERIGHHAFYKCDGLEQFYLAAQSEEDILLGGRWQPKNENKFSAEPPVFGMSREDTDAFNAARLAEENKKGASE